MTDEENKNPPVRIPQSEEAAEELASEGDEKEPGVNDQQRRNIARVQAELIGDIDPDE